MVVRRVNSGHRFAERALLPGRALKLLLLPAISSLTTGFVKKETDNRLKMELLMLRPTGPNQDLIIVLTLLEMES